MSGIREFYEIDEKEGIVVNKRLGKRAFLFGVEPWTSLVHRLFETFGSGAETILFDTGKSYGISSAEEEKRTENDSELRINFLSRKATTAGWGKIMVARESLEGFNIKVQRCVFCSEVDSPKEKQVPCFFLSGVISGFADVLFGPNRVREIHCGKDFCEFELRIGTANTLKAK